MIGSTLGPYEITAKLGEGGMGEVYRAKDPRLDREVAIKVLPEAFAADHDRLARFEREAKVLASLDHTNIAAIFEVGEAEITNGEGGTPHPRPETAVPTPGPGPVGRRRGVHYLVMQLVEGSTLAERMAQGVLELEEALAIARQIAEALEAAHEKGIVHRDLKPQNVKITPEGTVKVLDFGLAKAMDPAGAASGAGSPSQLAASPTLTLGATVQGMLLGTAGYMAPEQAKGVAVDKRADIWAFGVVLWEMLTGRRLFAGDSVPETLAGVLKTEIDPAALPDATPAPIRSLLRRCLERNPRNRLHDIADARIVLDEVLAGEVETEPASAPSTVRGNRRELVAWATAALAVVAAVALLWSRGSTTAPAPRVLRVTLPNPPEVTLELDGERAGMPAVSPDGRRIAFGARVGSGPMQIWVRDLDQAAARALPGTEGGYRPCWSPDGQHIAYFDWGALAVTSADGGPVTHLAPARDSRGCSWSPNGTLVYAPYAYGPLLAIPEAGGTPTQATRLDGDKAGATHRFPQFLPDGESFLYLSRPSPFGSPGKGAGVEVARLGSTSPPIRLIDLATNAVYADRHLLYARDGALVAQPFDPERLQLSGRPAVLVDDLLFNRRFSYGVFSAGGMRTIAFLSGEQRDLSRLVWRDRAGRRLGELGTPGNMSGYGGIAVSADGRWAAASRVVPGAADSDLWIFDLERGNETQLAHPDRDESDPIFSPDSRLLFYAGTAEGRTTLVRRDLARGTETEILTNEPDGETQGRVPMSLSPDGAWLTLDVRHFKAQADIALLPAEGGAEPRMLFASPADEAFSQISPDGRWLAWSSDESGRYEVYVTSFPEPGSRVQVSRAGGIQPRWNPRGGELFFKTPDNVLTAVPIELGSGTVSAGTPQPLFAITEFLGWTYDVAPDGERFLVREPIAESAASSIDLLTDWTSLARP